MRIVLVLFGCLLVAGVVALTVIQPPPASSPDSVEARRIALDAAPRPAAGSIPSGSRILDLFPEFDNAPAVIEADLLAPPSQALPQGQSAAASSSPSHPEGDRARLLGLINDWIYTNYSQLGQRVNGTIQKTRSGESFMVSEGQELEHGIMVHQITKDQLTLRLGESSFALRLAQKPEFFDDVRANPRPLTPDEQKQAFDFYMKRYGDKFKAVSQNYQPLPGMQMPQRISPEQQAKAREEYMKRYGRQFQREQQMYGGANAPNAEQMKQNFKDYWVKYHPDRPMPDFDTYLKSNSVAPAERLIDEPDSN